MDTPRTKNASEGIAPMGISSLNEAVAEPESRYECPVCLNWLRDPVITTCGHKFCKTCITSWLQNSGHCPIDNINLSMKVDIFPDNYTKREIQEQRMSCPFASKGCTVKVTPLDLDAHIAVCEHNQPAASRQPDAVPCSFRAVGCKELFATQEEAQAHLEKDTMTHMSYLMNAYSEIKITNDMSNANIDPKEQEAMSLWEAPGKDGDKQPPLTNTSALIRALYERVVVLEQRNREQDIVIANISKQLSALTVAKRKQNNEMLLRYCMGNYIWRIDNFKARLDAMLKDHSKMLYSPGFYTSPNGYRFCVRLNISPQNPLCFALHVHLMQTDYDECLEWPFNGRISFSMVNQYEPDLTQRDTMMSNSNLIAFRRPAAEICLRGFGYTEYAVVSDVVRNGFVKDDSLVFRVHIKSFNGRISFSMINQYEPDLTQRDTMMSNSNLIAFRRPAAEICLRGFGYTEYAAVSDVVRNGFVKDDALVFRVHIKSFNGRISFSMINQYEPDLTQRDTMMSNSNLIAFRRPAAEICLRGFGYTEYAVVSDVVRNGFVKDDSLVFRVHIKCV